MSADAMRRWESGRVGRPGRRQLTSLLALMTLALTTTSVGPAAALGRAAASRAVVSAAPAVVLAVSAPAAAGAGAAFAVRVTARDSGGATATGYRGAVRFTSTDTRSPVLPATYRFTAADAGTHLFTGVALHQSGTCTLTATDTASGVVVGTSGPIRVSPGPVARFAVAAPPTAVAGVGFAVQVTAKDAFYNIVTAYRGTVAFASNDGRAPELPVAYAFTAGDAGVHLFTGVVLHQSGSRTLTVRDTGTSALTGTSSPIAVGAGAVSRFAVDVPVSATAGVPFSITVTAKDPWFNVVTGYRGTVWSPNSGGAIENSYAFTAADKGVHTFNGAVLLIGGIYAREIDVYDFAAPLIMGSGHVFIKAGAPVRVSLEFPLDATAGVRFGFTVTVTDLWSNPAGTYRGTIGWTSSVSSSGSEFIPNAYSFTGADGAEVTFTPPSGALFDAPGVYRVTATDILNPALTGWEDVVVHAAAGS